MIAYGIASRRSLALVAPLGGVRALSSVKTVDPLQQRLRNPLVLGPAQEYKQDFFEVTDPAEPSVTIAHVPVMGRDATELAIDKASEVLPSWRDGTTATQRGNVLRAWSLSIKENAEDLATIMTMESGKPLKEAIGEVNYACSFLDYYAGEATRPTGAGGGFLVPTPFSKSSDGSPKGQIMAIQQAIGVTGVITPWNFPAAMITRSVGPALAAGCTSVLKPSELTPLTAVALHNLGLGAGLPDGVLQVITADRAATPEVGMELCTNPIVRQIHFTGSTAVGKWLMEHSSSTMKRLSLELGGNAPFIVFDDADIDQAVDAAMSSKFRNAGQTCVCADRFLVHESVHDEFVAKLSKKASAIQLGPGMERSTDLGPMITAEAAAKVEQKVNDAMQQGATCIVGGQRATELGSHFFHPTIMTGVPTGCELWASETFGPVAPIRSFSTDDEALQIANDSPVGLAGYFCTRDLSRAFHFSKQLECGMVGVNEGVISSCVAPFGGVKESGLGREGSPLGISEYLETKYVFLNA